MNISSVERERDASLCKGESLLKYEAHIYVYTFALIIQKRGNAFYIIYSGNQCVQRYKILYA